MFTNLKDLTITTKHVSKWDSIKYSLSTLGKQELQAKIDTDKL